MKYLYLLRHAEAESGGFSDKERVLSDQGVADARALGQKLRGENVVFDHVLCSDAVRTKQTLEGLQHGYGANFPGVHYEETLYTGGRGEYFHLIQSVPDTAGHLLVIGHNPTIYELAVSLAAGNPATHLDQLIMGYRPGTLSGFECGIEHWADLQFRDNGLTVFMEPN